MIGALNTVMTHLLGEVMLIDVLFEKLHMSGYAAYVWTSVCVVLGSLIVLYWVTSFRLRKALQTQERFLEKE